MLKYMDIKEILMCSGLRKTIEDVSSLFHRLNISELHSFITMNDTERFICHANKL